MNKEPLSRDEALLAIKSALKVRSSKAWSVTAGRGSVWGWITITATPARRVEFGYLSDADRAELASLLGLESVHSQGVSIPAGSAYYQEYVARARGAAPRVIGQPYWD